MGQFQPNYTVSTKHPLVKGFQVYSIKGPRPFSRGDNNEIAKIYWRTLKISRITGPISTKLGTKHSWVMRTQVCSNEGSNLLPRGDNNEIAKIHWQNYKIFSQNHWANFNKTILRGNNYEIAKIHWQNLESFLSRTLGQFQTWHKGSLCEWDSCCSNKEQFNSYKVNNGCFAHLSRFVHCPSSL